MGRARFIAVLTAIASVALLVPSVALAGTYTWDLASDFSSTLSANPDKDNYSGLPWFYEEGNGARLPTFDTFSTGIDNGLAGWHDSGNQPLVGINPAGSPISNGSATFPARQIVLQPSSSKPAVVTWTSPMSGAVVVTGSVVQDDAGHTLPLPCGDNTTWNVTNGTDTLASGNTPAPGSPTNFSNPATVRVGSRISLSVSLGLLGSPACDSTGVTFTITAASTTPTVTLTSPANGTVNSGGEPTLSGSATTGFGVSDMVNVKIYAGSSATGTPVQTINAHAGTTYSGRPNPALIDGTYTAQAEQSDLAGDVGRSATTIFRVKSNAPRLTISQPTAGAHLTDTQPTFVGTAGTAQGDSSHVSLTLFSGGTAQGSSLGAAQAGVNGGRWSLRWPQRLKFGVYTMRVSQNDDSGHTAVVNRSFVIGAPPNVIGSSVAISRRGVASIPIACTAPVGDVCTGDVQVLSVKNYRTISGGPAGKIRILFAYVRIPGGSTVVVKRSVQRDALHALRHLRGVHAKVITTLKDSGGPAKTVSAQRSIRLASH
ncbi:MAG: Ig-like domain-containing protein [Solirubrobacteraceae bacterium]